MSTDSSGTPAPARRGRRPGTSGTRQAILSAARARFANDGYAAATIRKIAADAGVDAALVMQFFRSKDELFAAVMSISAEALQRITAAFDGPDAALGERVTRAYLAVWDGDARDSEPLLAMLRGVIASEQAAEQLREFTTSRLLQGIDPRLRDDGATVVRVALASSMLIGVMVGRRLVRVPALAEADPETLVAVVAPAIQTILTGTGTGR
jgi:AcrR family transcriptional regulator